MKYMSVAAIFICKTFIGCGGEEENGGYRNFFDVPAQYKMEANPSMLTPGGIQVDAAGYEINLAILDERVLKIETCILRVMSENPVPDQAWQCIPANYKIKPLKRNYLIIKLVPPAPSCSNWQLLPIPAPDEYCIAKKLKPAPECPCMWRTAIQDENIILTPPPETRPDIPPTSVPAPYLWEIGRMMTGCNKIWPSPFVECLSY